MTNKPTPAYFSPTVPDFPVIGQYQPIYGKFDLTTYIQGASDYEIMSFLVQCYNATLKGYSDVTQLSKDTVTAYNQLQTWVNTWFDNLDVQHEINAKLQEMYDNGSLAEAIASSDAIIPAMNNYLNTPTGNENLYGATSRKINAMAADGTLADIVEETDQVPPAVTQYLNTADGSKKLSDATAKKINNMAATGELGTVISGAADLQKTTTDWLHNNVTPVGSAVVVDKSLTIEGAAADSKASGNSINSLKDGKLNFDIINNSYVANSNGDIISYSGWSRTDYIDCSKYKIVKIKSAITVDNNCFYASDKSFISNFNLNGGYNLVYVPANAKYFILSNTTQNMEVCEIYTNDSSYIECLKNMLAKNVFDNVSIIQNKYVDDEGKEHSYNGYNCTDFILYNADNFIVKCDFSNSKWLSITCFDEQKNYISSSYTVDESSKEMSKFTLPSETKFVRLSYKNTVTNIFIYNEVVAPLESKILSLKTTATSKSKIKVMSTNVLRFEDKNNLHTNDFVNAHRKFYGKYNPDIICMQEYEKSINKDDTLNPNEYLYNNLYDVVDNLSHNDENHCAIATKNVVENYDVLPLTDNYNILRAYLNVDGKKVCICNVHLDYNETSDTLNRQQMELIRNIVDGEEYVIICGDFNNEDYDIFTNTYMDNLFNKYKGTYGKQLNREGNAIDNQYTILSDYIEVSSNTIYSKNNDSWVVFYDRTKTKIGSVVYQSPFTTPINCAYIRTYCDEPTSDSFVIYQGTTIPNKRKTYNVANRGWLGDFWTWDWFGEYGTDRARRIDNIIVSKNIIIDNVEMTEILTSDHHALVADLTIR